MVSIISLNRIKTALHWHHKEMPNSYDSAIQALP
jgi:hypothetical protein